MESIYQVLNNYKLHVRAIENTDLTKIKNLTAGISLSRKTIVDLRVIIRENNGFKAENDEIHFFKHIKPLVSGKLQFFGELHTFQLKWPKADVKNQKRYIRQAIKKLENKKKENLTFWRYVKNKQTQNDSIYFLRCNHEIGINCDMSQYIVDPEFTTSYDNLMAHIVASQLLTKHYNKLLLKLDNKEQHEFADLIFNKNWSWSGSKTDLIELIYAFHSSGAINNGQAEISKMIQFSEIFFNIKLRNPYKTFSEIKARTNDQTKFIDTLKQALLAKINADDAKSK